MTREWIKGRIAAMVAEDELWLAQARAVMAGCDGDVGSMEDRIAQVQRDVDRMQELL